MTEAIKTMSSRIKRRTTAEPTVAAGYAKALLDRATSRGAGEQDTRTTPNEFPELTESTFARMICGIAHDFGDIPIAKAVHVTHAEPSYRSEYDRLFKVPVVFRTDKNAIVSSVTEPGASAHAPTSR
jgi:Arabinose-binding domain of AraC transcription regulator, N-term